VGIVTFFESDASLAPRGSDRFFWASMQPDQSAARWRLPSGQGVVPHENPATCAGVATWSAALGNYFNRNNVNAGVAHFARGDSAAITPSITPSFPMQSVAPVAYPSERDVLVYREVIQWSHVADAAVPAIHGTVHGFTCQFETQYTGAPNGTFAGNVRCYIGIGFQVRTGLYVLVTKAKATAAVLTPIPLSVYDGAQWALVEHRLYQPTTQSVGRYELWFNQAKYAEILGTDPNFPLPTQATEKYGAMAWLSDTWIGKSGGIRSRFSEIFTCANTDAALAY
jgi:hypothetical protein